MNRPIRTLKGRNMDPLTPLVEASADDLTPGVVTSEKLLAAKEIFTDRGSFLLDMTFSKGRVAKAIAACSHRHLRHRRIEGRDAMPTGGPVKWG